MSFWPILTLLVVLALAFVLVPLRRVCASSSRWTVFALLVLMPVMTLAMYLHLGAPSIVDSDDMLQARGEHNVDSMMAALEARLKANPNDAQALYVMGRSYLALQRTAEAEATLAKAAALAPQEARMLSQYAEVLAMNRQGDLQGAAKTLIEQALELDFQDEKALELAGLAAYQRAEWAQAVHFWRRLLKRLPAQSEFHQDMAKAIADAEEKSAKASGLGDRAKLQPPTKAKGPH